MNSKFLTVGIIVFFVALLSFILFFQGDKAPSRNSLQPVVSGAFGGDYTLVDQDGHTVTNAAFEGQYQLIYFGFTYCPAICPTELSKMAEALDTLPPETVHKIQPLFITVDPERDTAEVMKGYVSHFHPKLIGLTGSVEQIEHVKKLYKVYAAKVDDPSLSDYTMDHSSYIYFLSPDGTLLSLFKIDDPASYVSETIQRWMKQS